MRRSLFAITCLLLSTFPVHAEAIYDVDKVMAALRSTPADLVLLTPHRGLWEDVPENTIDAVERALRAGFETVEIDVRLNGSGTPWLMHDYNLDRLTEAHGPLASYRDATLETVRLRDRHGIVTDHQLVSLEAMFRFFAGYLSDASEHTTRLRGAVLIIDLKSPPGGDPKAGSVSGYQALKASWAVLRRIEQATGAPLRRATVFKLKAKEIPSPEVLANDLALTANDVFHFMPVMHPDDEPNGDRVLAQYFDSPHAIGFEAVMESSTQKTAAKWIERLKQAGRTVPGFPGWNDYPEGVAFSSGLCCMSRNTDADDTSRNLDYSGSFEYQLQIGANWITADTVEFLHSYLAARHLRNLDQLR